MSQGKPSVASDDATDSLVVFAPQSDIDQLQVLLRRLNRTPMAMQSGGLAEAVSWCAQYMPPAVMVIDIGALAQPLQLLGELKERCGPTTKIILLGEHQDVDFYRKLLQSGALDYLLKPLSLDLLAGALLRAEEGTPLDLAGHARAGATVALVGAGGGVGVSTISAGLGQILSARRHTPTVLVDFDRSKGDLPLLLGTEADTGLSSILAAPEIDARQLQRTLQTMGPSQPGSPQRLQLLSQRPGPHEQASPEQVLLLGDALSHLFSLSLWDIPAHLPDGAREVLTHADVRIAVTELNVAHARHLHRLVREIGDESGGQRLLIVINPARSGARPAISRDQFEQFIERKIDIELPHAGLSLSDSLVRGPLNVAVHAAFSQELERLADLILNRQHAAPAARTMSWLHKVLRRPAASLSPSA